MPNHLAYCLQITHKDQNKLVRLMRCWKKNYLDFEKIVPPPKNYYRGSIGFGDTTENDESLAKKGLVSWYRWNIDNWDTKWNSYDGELLESKDKFVCRFLTAWSPPTAIYTKLEELGFEVKGLWKDEGDSEVHVIGEDYGAWYADVSFEYCG